MRKLFVTSIILLAVLAHGCEIELRHKRNSFQLRPGDLLFQDLDAGPLCDAIEKVTTGYRGANLTHVGVVAEAGRIGRHRGEPSWGRGYISGSVSETEH